jgi:hypothetical protein
VIPGRHVAVQRAAERVRDGFGERGADASRAVTREVQVVIGPDASRRAGAVGHGLDARAARVGDRTVHVDDSDVFGCKGRLVAGPDRIVGNRVAVRGGNRGLEHDVGAVRA